LCRHECAQDLSSSGAQLHSVEICFGHGRVDGVTAPPSLPL
jgi:hypothetical protein